MTYVGYFSYYDIMTYKIIKLNGGQNIMDDKCFEFENNGLVVLNQIIFYVS